MKTVRVGKYEVLAHIATGGMGAVYRARDMDLGREVALKVLTPDMAAKPVMLERFRREARSAAKLRHENIVSIYEFSEANGTHFLAMEFVDGIDLHEYINRKGKLDPEEARQIVMQAARALAHAHKQGIVHRDIKPSNFLITRKHGQPLAKLTDMGLARETREDECRVTRDGTTVGTVDYMSPEQARDSGLADVRSDIYSLGCTLYHMLAGHAPFAEGSMAERIYKHVEAEPDDIRTHNPKVSAGLGAVLRRMLAKNPANRYQTPRELLKDLEHPEDLEGPPSLELLAGLADGVDEKPKARPKDKETRRAPKASNRARGVASPKRPAEAPESDERPARQPAPAAARDLRPWIFGALMVVVLAVGAVWALLGNGSEGERDGPTDQPARDKTNRPKPNDVSARDGGGKRVKETAVKVVELPRLYQPPVAIDADQLRREFQEPEVAAPAADAQVFRVSRGAPQGNMFASLAEAIRQAPAGKDTVIEIHDNGPLFEPAVAVTGRNVVIRGGPGFRPLIAWDVPAGKDGRFLSVGAGILTLQGLDVVVWNEWQGRVAHARAALFRVIGGRLVARDCTFSTAGKHPLGVALVEMWSGESTLRPAGVPMCLLSRCFARGADLTAVAADNSGANIHIDRCLLVGSDRPVLQISASNHNPTTVRVFRSTLVSGKTLLKVTAEHKEDLQPAVRWSSWDTLLAQSNPLANGNLVELPPAATTAAMRWQAVNCLYAGWKHLLAGGDNIAAADLDDWHRCWGHAEGDKAIPATWPRRAPADPEEVSPRQYGTMHTEAGFAATSGPGTLGCDVNGLLKDWPTWGAARKAWLVLTYKPFPTAPPPALEADQPAEDDTIDLTRTDLGARIEMLAMSRKPGARLVVRLTGSGDCPTTPVRVRRLHLVLIFDEARAKANKQRGAKPLTLVPLDETAVDQEALFDVEDGSLELRGGRVRFANTEFAKLPRYMLRGKNADLRLSRCRLDGPMTAAPAGYCGLIRLEGSGKTDAEKTPACAVSESLLISGRVVIQVVGTGARLALAGSLVLAANDALRLDPGATALPPLTMQCLLERNTFVVKGALIHLADAPKLAAPVEPIIVQADSNFFLDPFTDMPRRATLLRYAGQALPRGLLLWQGKNNGYDAKRLHAYVTTGAAATTQSLSVWQHLWGSRGEQYSRPRDLTRSKVLSFPLDKLPLEKLAQSALLRPKRGEPPLGADLAVLSVVSGQ